MNEEIVKLLQDANLIVKGDVNLRAGQKSDIYFDIKKAYGNPLLLEKLGDSISKLMRDETCVAASGHGGIALATAISIKKNLPLVMVRDAPKDHGQKKIIDGYIPKTGDKVAIIDDVLTTGSSIRKTAENLLPTGAKINAAYIVVKRTDVKMDFPIKHLVEAKSLI